jgi:hypothetical protein
MLFQNQGTKRESLSADAGSESKLPMLSKMAKEINQRRTEKNCGHILGVTP